MDKYWFEVRLGQREDDWVSVHSLGYHLEHLEDLVELGIIELRGDNIHVAHVIRLRKFFRLRDTLGVNASGAAIILDLLDRIERLQEELRYLREK